LKKEPHKVNLDGKLARFDHSKVRLACRTLRGGVLRLR